MEVYGTMKKLYDRTVNFINEKSLDAKLEPGMAYDQLLEYEEHLSQNTVTKQPLPDDLRCWYLLTQGQIGDCGLFGKSQHFLAPPFPLIYYASLPSLNS